MDVVEVWIFEIKKQQKSELFLRYVLAHYLAQSTHLIIERNEWGKPYLRDFPQLQFNVSHSGQKWLMAISDSFSIGVDVEKIKPRQSLIQLVKKCFAPAEQHYWFNLPDDEKLSIFYDFWTRKEAVVKGIGRGIALGLNRCEIDMTEQNHFIRLPIAEQWFTQKIQVSDLYCAAIATPSPNITIKICNL